MWGRGPMNADYTFITHSEAETEGIGAAGARAIPKGRGLVVALFGGMGAGKTAFVRGMAAGLGLQAEVSSPTFALVHEYGGNPGLVHFDLYRLIPGKETGVPELELETTGFYDYLDQGCILAVEWSEYLDELPPHSVRVVFTKLDDRQRKIEIFGGDLLENFGG